MVCLASLNELFKLLCRTSGPNGLRPIWQTSAKSSHWSTSPPYNSCFTAAEENGKAMVMCPLEIGWNKYLWAIQPRNWSLIWFRSMRQFDLSPWGVPSAIWSTMAQLHQSSHVGETQTQSRFRINRGLGSSQQNSLSPIGTRLQPFQHLDEARRAQGHCGLGITILPPCCWSTTWRQDSSLERLIRRILSLQ